MPDTTPSSNMKEVLRRLFPDGTTKDNLSKLDLMLKNAFHKSLVILSKEQQERIVVKLLTMVADSGAQGNAVSGRLLKFLKNSDLENVIEEQNKKVIAEQNGQSVTSDARADDRANLQHRLNFYRDIIGALNKILPPSNISDVSTTLVAQEPTPITGVSPVASSTPVDTITEGLKRQRLDAEAFKTLEGNALQTRFAGDLRKVAVEHLGTSNDPLASNFREQSDSAFPAKAGQENYYKSFLREQGKNKKWATDLEARAIGEALGCRIAITDIKEGKVGVSYWLYPDDEALKESMRDAPILHLYYNAQQVKSPTSGEMVETAHYHIGHKYESTIGDGNCLYNGIAQLLKGHLQPDSREGQLMQEELKAFHERFAKQQEAVDKNYAQMLSHCDELIKSNVEKPEIVPGIKKYFSDIDTSKADITDLRDKILPKLVLISSIIKKVEAVQNNLPPELKTELSNIINDGKPSNADARLKTLAGKVDEWIKLLPKKPEEALIESPPQRPKEGDELYKFILSTCLELIDKNLKKQETAFDFRAYYEQSRGELADRKGMTQDKLNQALANLQLTSDFAKKIEGLQNKNKMPTALNVDLTAMILEKKADLTHIPNRLKELNPQVDNWIKPLDRTEKLINKITKEIKHRAENVFFGRDTAIAKAANKVRAINAAFNKLTYEDLMTLDLTKSTKDPSHTENQKVLLNAFAQGRSGKMTEGTTASYKAFKADFTELKSRLSTLGSQSTNQQISQPEHTTNMRRR